ncbi:ArnT family glycosyltransferase [Halocatena salina]|uniref:Glycosyltransferase family 39 protein n=1 Tax=Halocatena salina TaxID=2934340 RepID=A0A8U0A5K7_9EURY|nr:glycosyltransferase family 39 protein [Halocatena salina]UPM43758.1 glycosyltransferase family 39 protein [Halocatena salina]
MSDKNASGLWFDDRFWLAMSLFVGSGVYIAYLLTHTHPAYEGGLYLQFVEEIIQNGYVLPERIPHYLEGGIPFAYPPLVFYLIAIITDVTGVDPVALELYVPGAIAVVYLIPFYYLTKELVGSPGKAGIGTIFFAVTPSVLRWHISAGGIVRAVAVLFTLLGIYAGVKLFQTGDRRWLVPGTVLFSLTLLTHPVYTVFFGSSYLLLFAFHDRTLRGLLNGAIVATGGIVLTAPWWLQIATTHGLDIYLSASGTHTGLFGGVGRLASQFVYPIWDMDVVTPFYVIAFAGGLYALYQRRYFLPTWMVIASYIIGKQRFTFVAGAMLSAVLVVDLVVPALSSIISYLSISISDTHRKMVPIGVAVVLVLGAVGTGVAFAGSELTTTHQDSRTQPQTVDDDDLRAVDWIKNETQPNETFVVLSDAAEWVPYYSERTVILSPWGAEWTTTSGYYTEYELFRDIATCSNVDCLNVLFGLSDRQPDYVYVPRDVYTVHGDEYSPDPGLLHSMNASEKYSLRHKNPGVAVFELTDTDTSVSNGSNATSNRSQ